MTVTMKVIILIIIILETNILSECQGFMSLGVCPKPLSPLRGVHWISKWSHHHHHHHQLIIMIMVMTMMLNCHPHHQQELQWEWKHGSKWWSGQDRVPDGWSSLAFESPSLSSWYWWWDSGLVHYVINHLRGPEASSPLCLQPAHNDHRWPSFTIMMMTMTTMITVYDLVSRWWWWWCRLIT